MKKQLIAGILTACLLAASLLGTAAAEFHPDLILGDVNVDSRINVLDATVIQELLAECKTDSVLDAVNDDSLLDIDGNRKISIADVTQLMEYIAGYPDETCQIGTTCYQWHDKEYAYEYPVKAESLSDKEGYDSAIDYSAEPVGSTLLSDEGYRDVRVPIGTVTDTDCVGLNLVDLFGTTQSFPSADGIETVPTEKQEETTGFIPALPGKTYVLTAIANANVFGVSLYDNSKHFLGRTQTSGNRTTYTVDRDDVRYIRITAWNNSLFSVTLVNDPAQNSGDWYKQTSVTDGFITGGTGEIKEDVPENGCVATSYIPVIAGEIIFEHTQTTGIPWMCIATYTPDKQFIERNVYAITDFFKNGRHYSSFLFTVGDGVGYIRASCRTYLDGVHNLYIGDQQQMKELFESKVSSAVNDTRVLDTQGNLHAVNHRGYNRVAPENTLSAYKLSKKAGFQYVECDVSLTADRVPVLLHDDSIDRTSNGSGNIEELTYDQVKDLDFGSWKSAAYAGEKIPTFEEFIRLCKSIGLHPYIELKPKAHYTQEDINNIVRIVNRYGMHGKVSYISINPQWIEYVKNADDEARLGYVVAVVNHENVAKCIELRTGKNEVFLDANYIGMTDERAQLSLDAQIPLEVWTPNTVESILSLHPYISGVTSDWLNVNEVLYSHYIND